MDQYPTPLAQLMRQLNVTQVALAAESGVSQPAISDLAAGKREPTIATAKALVDALSRISGLTLTLDALFGSQGSDLVEPVERAS